jgi:steroid 5-alpha reductase family enzyme
LSEHAEAWWRGLFWVTLSYFVAATAGLASVALWPSSDALWAGVQADVVATCVVFLFSFAFGNSSFYDPYWSVAPLFLAGGWAVVAGAEGDRTRQALLLGGLGIWGARLTYNWLRGWGGLTHEDWRYVDLRRKTGALYWLVSLFGLHLFPTVWVLLGMWPAWYALTVPHELNALDVLGAGALFGGALIEALADQQLHRFRETRTQPDEILQTGLWRWSRHPNYFGEISVWCGVWLLGLAATPTAAVAVVGPLAMVGLFRFISIPMAEARAVERKPGYEAIIASTSMIVPWPW